MNHFIDTAAPDLSRARTVGLNQLTPAPWPVMVVGTTSTHRFFFASAGVLESFSGAPDYSLRVTLGGAIAAPVRGTWELTVGAETAEELAFDIDAAGLEKVLNDSATITSEGGVTVSSAGPGRFLIAHKTEGAVAGLTVDGASLVPDCTARVSVLAAGDASTRNLFSLELRRNLPLQDAGWQAISTPWAGWSGTLSLTSADIYQLLETNGVLRGDFLECTTLITVEVIDSNDNPTAYFQSPVLLRALNYATNAASSSSMQQAYFVKPNVVGLASANANATLLGGLSTANGEYPIGGTIQCLFPDSVTALFVRKNTTVNQNVPWVVRPFDYNASSNPYQWAVDEVRQYGSPCTWDPDISKWTFLVTQGNANAVAVGADQTRFSLPS